MLFYKRPYLMSKNKFLVVKKYINKYLNKGFIYFSISLVATSILLAKKLRGGIWFCINYRGLNTIVIKNWYPVLLIYKTFKRLSQAKIYTKLNIITAFNHLQIREGDKWKTVFILHFSQFKYTVIPFGVYNGPDTF